MIENQKKILIAEDEKSLAKALSLKLGREGYVVDVALNGEDAIEKLEKEKYDLLLMDLVMPKKDGFAVLEELSKKGIKLPIIITSNLGQEEDQKRVMEYGVKEYLVKAKTPLTDIVDHIKKALA